MEFITFIIIFILNIIYLNTFIALGGIESNGKFLSGGSLIDANNDVLTTAHRVNRCITQVIQQRFYLL